MGADSENDSASCDMFVHSIAELVMATGDYSAILGRRDSKDYRHPGLLDRLHPQDAHTVIAKIASIVEKRGLSEQAVCLYDLAGKKEQVLVILNRMLAPLVNGMCIPGDTRDRVVNVALEIAERYQKKGKILLSDLSQISLTLEQFDIHLPLEIATKSMQT